MLQATAAVRQLLTATDGYREASSGIDRYMVDSLKLDILLFRLRQRGAACQLKSSLGIANTSFSRNNGAV